MVLLIRDIAPYIGNRAVPSLPPSTPLYFGASLLGERAIDSIAVVERGNFIGELRFLDVIRYLYRMKDTYQTPLDLHNVDIQQVMSSGPNIARIDDTLQHIINLIEKSGTGVIFIVDNSHLIGSISIIDILSWFVNSREQIDKRPIDIASKHLVHAQADISIEEIVLLMFNNYIRRILIRQGSKLLGVIDDRALTNTMFSGKYDHKKFIDIWKQHISDAVKEIGIVKSDASILDTARAILDSSSRCVLIDGKGIVTPWDIVVKAIRNHVNP